MQTKKKKEKKMAQKDSKKPTYYAALPLKGIPFEKLTASIDKADLDQQPGKDPIERNPHISLHVQLPSLPSLALQAKIQSFSVFQVVLNGVGCFENKDKDVLFLQVQVTDPLRRLHQLLVDEYKQAWQHPQYTPHVTLAFLKPGKAKTYVSALEESKPIALVADATRVEFRQHASMTKDASDVLVLPLSDAAKQA